MCRWQKLTLQHRWIAEISSPTSRTCRASKDFSNDFKVTDKSCSRLNKILRALMELQCAPLIPVVLWSVSSNPFQSLFREAFFSSWLLLSNHASLKGRYYIHSPIRYNYFGVLAYKTPCLNGSGLKNKSWRSLKRMLWLSSHLPPICSIHGSSYS